MAVQVDICGSGMRCLAAGCETPARVWIESDASPRMHYCPADAAWRIAMYRSRFREVEISDAARAALGQVTA